MTRLRTLFRHSLVWPVLTLALLFALDVAYRPGFLSITLLDGHLFGAPVDILNRAAPLVIVSLGMTLVIATRGIDISVGAIVAIAGRPRRSCSKRTRRESAWRWPPRSASGCWPAHGTGCWWRSSGCSRSSRR